jgi:glycosyltransferase involved in cell wall biosynthesis
MSAKVTVILPVYNRAASVRRAIDSALAQTYRDFEVVVVDDGSTDDTVAALASYGSDITVLTGAHAGPYAARNAALRATTSELVAFLDSDDRWLPHKLELQVPLFARKEVALVFGNATIPGTGRSTFWITPPKRGRVADHFLWGNFVSTTTVVARRDALGFFPEDIQLSTDLLAWFRVAQHHELDYVDGPVAEYNVHPGGISYDLGRSLQARIDLFAAELQRTTHEEDRVLIRRMLFHLALHLGVAAIRGRASGASSAWKTGKAVAGMRAVPWLATFAVRHAALRGRRLFA